ncbi:unnamed protein product, partial [Prorocentrum cordatum]
GPRQRERSRTPFERDAQLGAKAAGPPAGARGRRFMYGLAVLAVTSVLLLFRGVASYEAGGELLHVEPEGKGALEVAAEAVSEVASEGAQAVSEGVRAVSGMNLAQAPAEDVARTADGASDASDAVRDHVQALEHEIAGLKDLVNRHDKMLRYVMDRYVEKAVGTQTASVAAEAQGVKLEEHKSSEVNLDAPEFVSKSDPGRAGDLPRRRKGSGSEISMGGVGGGEEAAQLGSPLLNPALDKSW